MILKKKSINRQYLFRVYLMTYHLIFILFIHITNQHFVF